MNIQDKLQQIEDRFAGTYKKELQDIWHQLHILDRLRIAISDKHEDDYLKLAKELYEQVSPVLKVKLLDPYAKVPTRGSKGAIGWDIYALIVKDTFTSTPTLQYLDAHQRRAMSTGIAVAIPPGYYGRIAPRSGLAVKQGVDVLAGVIDEDYRGEIKVVLLNTTDESILVDLDKPIAQLILERADGGVVMVVEELDETERGAGGFGSSDKCKHARTRDGVCQVCGEDYRQWGE